MATLGSFRQLRARTGVSGAITILLGGVSAGVARVQVHGVVHVLLSASLILFALTTAIFARLDATKPRRLRLSSGNKTPRPFSDLKRDELGVVWSSFGQEAPYVERDGDLELEGLVRGEGPLVVVAGPRLAGATSMLAHAATEVVPDCLVIQFEDVSNASLRDLAADAAKYTQGRAAVLWLDGAGLEVLEQLTSPFLSDLPDGIRLFVTTDEQLLNPQVLGASYRVVTAPGVLVTLGLISTAERSRLSAESVYATAAATYPESPTTLGRLLLLSDSIARELAVTDSASLARVSVVRAATDWSRTGVSAPLTKARLIEVARGYWRELANVADDATLLEAELSDAVKAAQVPIKGFRLIGKKTLQGQAHLQAHPLLVVLAEDRLRANSWPVPSFLWHYLGSALTPAHRRVVGLAAYARRDLAGAASMLRDLEPSEFDALLIREVAQAAEQAVDTERARRWMRAAVETGDINYAPWAMLHLGLLEKSSGNPERATHWFGQAARSEHSEHSPAALVELGIARGEEGDYGLARSAFQLAVNFSHPEHSIAAMHHLGKLEHWIGDDEKAQEWFKEALHGSHPKYSYCSLVHLGHLDEEAGNHDAARHWWKAAIDSAHADAAPMAMLDLGWLEDESGNLNDARFWYEAGIADGHPRYLPQVMHNLGLLEHREGNLERARDLFQSVIDGEDTDRAPRAMNSMGCLEEEVGDVDKARYWYRKAMSTTHSVSAWAACNLGELERRQGLYLIAKPLLLRAVRSRHASAAPAAMFELGLLEISERSVAQARLWFEAAVRSGDGEHSGIAMLEMAALELEHGTERAARDWLERAANTSSESTAAAAEEMRQALDALNEDKRRAHHWATIGYLAHEQSSTDPTPITRSRESDHHDML